MDHPHIDHRDGDPSASGPRRRPVRRRRTTIALAALVTAVAATGCAGGGDDPSAVPGPSGEATVAEPRIVVELFRFEPQAATAEVGQRITWSNTDGIDHAVTTDDGRVDLALPVDGEVFHHFDDVGTYEYHCSVHPSMTGTVVVG